MFRPHATAPFLPVLLALAAVSAGTLTSCKNSGLKFPKLKWKNTAGAPENPADPGPVETADTAGGLPAPVPRSPEETAFLEACATLGATGGSTVAGRDGWNFSGLELQRLSQLQDPAAPSIRAATAAISDYAAQLKRRGTELIFVPVPPKAIIFPDKLSRDLKIKARRNKPARLDSTLQTVYDQLRSRGVRVIDVTEELIANREARKQGPVFPKTAAVWSPRGAETAATFIAASLKDAPWANQPGKDGPLITEAAVLTYTGPLTTGDPAETLPIRNIGRAADGKMRSVTFSQGGHPLALLGDHTLLAWREANNPAGSSGAFGSLADQLAFELQTTPDLFPGKTEGRNAPRVRIMREGTGGRNPLSSAKTLIWVVQATDLALADWKRIPLRLDFNLAQPTLQLTTPGAPGSSPAAPPPSPDARISPSLPDSASPSGEPELPR